MGMELSKDFTDDAGTFTMRSGGTQVQFIHGKEDASMDGFESIASVGEGTAQNDGESVLQKGLFDFRWELNLTIGG
jgi:hypothetical protein